MPASGVGRFRQTIAEAVHGVQQALAERPIDDGAQHRQVRVQRGDIAAGVAPQRMREFGQAGHGKDYKPLSIEEMAKGYASGKLDTRPSLAGTR